MTSEIHKASRETAKAALVSQSKISKIELEYEQDLKQVEYYQRKHDSASTPEQSDYWWSKIEAIGKKWANPTA